MLALALIWVLAAPAEQGPDPYVIEREQLVQELAAASLRRPPIEDPRVLEALRATERHRYVPERFRHASYKDRPLPIGHQQTISQPWIVAHMTEQLATAPEHRVLEVGTGSGYQAALLSRLVAQVYSIEIVPELASRAAADLKDAGRSNVTVRAGDGYRGWPEHAPFDSIVVTAAPDHLPQPLVEQLKVGGRLVLPIGPDGGVQELKTFVKNKEGTLELLESLPVRFVPLTGEGAQKASP